MNNQGPLEVLTVKKRLLLWLVKRILSLLGSSVDRLVVGHLGVDVSSSRPGRGRLSLIHESINCTFAPLRSRRP